MPITMHGFLYDLIDTEEDRDIFCTWAFGEDYITIEYGADLLYHWNKRHGELYILKICGNIYDDIPIMVDLWRKCGNQES